ncbi:ROK family protein [Streptomyces sp. NPDC056817]|uniref:ROK family protein n=1 Tax=Streptomyces sp. NPDC056817 TaxID=3345950 RepID=UPI0036C2B926
MTPTAPAGPPPTVVAGVDVGGTNMVAALATPDGQILAEHAEPTAPGDQLAAQIAAVLSQLRDRLADPPLAALAVGVPGIPDPATGRVYEAPALPALAKLNLADALAERIGVVPAMANDVDMAALAEGAFGGHGDAAADLAVIALGTGIGLGLVTGGQLVTGHRGGAGEIALLPVAGDPFASASWTHGPLESVVRSAALVAAYHAGGGNGAAGVPEIFAAARRGERAACQAVDTYARGVALAVLAVRAVADPALFVLTGGIGAAPGLREAIQRWLNRTGGPPIHLTVSRLGARAPLLGAVAAAMRLPTNV